MLNLSIALIKVFSPGGGRQANKKLPALSEPLLQLPAHQLARMIRDGQLSSERLVELMSERLRQVQPLVNAMCQERFSEALEEARQLDSFLNSIRSGQRQLDELTSAERELLESPLLGVPVSVKESIQVRGMRNSCGLWARRHEVASEDAVVVANVRRYGMIPICTSNIPECTLFWADCQNCVYGRSLNPYDGARITGASSGGEGALLGSGASLLGIGSDIGGSLRIPAHYCGIYSHKPSPFLLSCEGNFPAQKSARLRMFTLGPMCRYASDLRPMLKCLMRDCAQENKKLDSYYKHQPENIAHLRQQLLTKLDQLDNGLECVLSSSSSSSSSSEAVNNQQQQQTKTLKVYYFEFNQESSLQGTQSVKINDELAQGQRDVLEHLTQKFAAKLEHLNLDKYLKKCLITWQCLLRCASKQDRDDAYEDDELKHVFGIDSLSAEFIKMPFGLSKHTKESLLALILGSAVPRERQKAFELCEKFELHAQELREEIIEKLTPRDSNNDEECVLIMPTLPTVAYKHNVALAKTPDIRFPALFNVLQLPVTHATIRLDKSHGLPYGVSIAARPYADHLTLAVAEEIELAFGGWTPPGSKLARAADAANRNTTDTPSSVATIARPSEANAATINQKAEQQTKTTLTTTIGAVEQTAQ